MLSILCRLAGHSRSAKRAKFDYQAQSWQSNCQHCDQPMSRTGKGQWCLTSELEPEAAVSPGRAPLARHP